MGCKAKHNSLLEWKFYNNIFKNYYFLNILLVISHNFKLIKFIFSRGLIYISPDKFFTLGKLLARL